MGWWLCRVYIVNTQYGGGGFWFLVRLAPYSTILASPLTEI
jgi:hypothetical protein